MIARAPFRVSLAGGGTDLPAYYERYGGVVVSTTIDRFVYVHVGQHRPGRAQITSADFQTFYRQQLGETITWDGDLALPRAVLHEFDLSGGVALFVSSEVPPGTGLGSSSAVAVALVQGIATYVRRPLSRHQVAELACKVEIEKLRAPIGKQDQFAAAFGGLNTFSFQREGVTVEPVKAPAGVLELLERRLLLFFTGTARDSANILREQQRASANGVVDTVDGLHRIKDTALALRASLEQGDLDGVGRLLDEGWRQKRRLTTGITNPRIDQIYDLALANGAVGGKITGAGGGGFLLLYAHEDAHEALTDAMEQRGLRRMDFRFDRLGVTTASVSWAADKGSAERD